MSACRVEDRARRCHPAGPLLFNDVIHAELAVRYERMEDLDAFIEETGLELVSLPREALFLAGKVFTQYRRAGGSRKGVLPACFIGAQAAVEKGSLLARDMGRDRTYFPMVDLITPDSQQQIG